THFRPFLPSGRRANPQPHRARPRAIPRARHRASASRRAARRERRGTRLEVQHRALEGYRGAAPAIVMTSILVADDEPHVLRVLKVALEREGYAVATAANGEVALEQIHRQ